MSSDRIETVILSNLIQNEEYSRQVIPFLKSDYFHQRPDRQVYDLISTYFDKYNKVPSQTALIIDAEDLQINKEEFDNVNEIISGLTDKEPDGSWLIEKTEKFCRDKSVYNAIMQSISIIEGKDKQYSTEALPALLQEAINVSFDKSVGHDYSEDAESRYDFYHHKEDKIPFDLEMFNKITKGGIPRKTLSAILAPTGMGKSLFLCHHAAASIKAGKNALYISMEMSEERIAERIDCNLLDIDIDQLYRLGKKDYINKFEEIRSKTYGKLVIKEYPTSSAHAGHFRALLDELKLKKNFIPDIIYIDYINICSSQKLKSNGAVNSYTLIKSIAEELRALAVENNVPIFTATQTNRGGVNNSDISMTDTSESFGLPMSLDFFFAMIRTEELDNLGQLMVTQLKSRFGDINYYRKFIIGIDIKKFKLFDSEQSAQQDLVDAGHPNYDDVPMFDKSQSSRREKFNDFDFS